jgi:hypothetical protein
LTVKKPSTKKDAFKMTRTMIQLKSRPDVIVIVVVVGLSYQYIVLTVN